MLKILFLVLLLPACLPLLAKEKSIKINEKYRIFMTKYCIDCHNAKKQKGKVRLDTNGFPFEIRDIKQADQWQHILTAINSKEMPPEDEAQPGAQEKLEFLDMLSEKLVEARDMLSDTGGKVTMRRLNRRDYKNTMESLLGIQVNVSDLPDDLSSETFDTNGNSLFMSSDQIEKYLSIARSSISQALNNEVLKKPAILRIEPEIKANEQISRRHKEYIRRNEAAIAYEKAKKAGSKKKPKDFGVVDEAEVYFAKDHYERFFASYDHYLKHSYTKTGVIPSLWHPIFEPGITINSSLREISIKNNNGTSKTKLVRKKLPDGLYKIRARVSRFPNAPSERCFLDLRYGDDRKLIKTFQITASLDSPQIIEENVLVGPETRNFVFREKAFENGRGIYVKDKKINGYGSEPAMWIDWIEYEGPIQPKTPALLQNVIAEINNGKLSSTKASEVLQKFSKIVFREKEVDKKYIHKLTEIFNEEVNAGIKPREAIIEPLAIILSSPSFLYFAEPVPEQKQRELTQNELSTRLAYFLWSSPADSELRKIATSNTLKGSVLKEQVDRLLDDERSINFIRAFTYQWLNMERLSFFKFDRKLNFGGSQKKAAEEEVYQTIKYIIDNNLGTEKLLKSDFIVINGLMAEHYGIDGISGEEFRRVNLPKGSIRGGLTGMAAILAMGTDGNHTSPVERGAWVLRKILNKPPPPAPANVPQLSRLEGKNLSAHEVLKIHQEEPQCSHCHKKIDPIGLGLENFDPTGKWREQVIVGRGKRAKAQKIDIAGSLHRGPEFKNYLELRDIFHSKVYDFNRGLITSLLAYSTNRDYGFSDQKLIDYLQKGMKDNKNSLRWLIHTIVKLKVFQVKK